MIETLAFVLTGLGLTASIVYYANILKNANQTRELQLKAQEQALKTRNATFFNQTVGLFVQGKEALNNILILQANQFSSIEEYRELSKNPEYVFAYLWVEQMFEIFGIYLKQGVVDIEMISLYQPWFYSWFWGMYKDVIYDNRKRTNRSSYCQNCEYFCTTIIDYLKEHPELAP